MWPHVRLNVDFVTFFWIVCHFRLNAPWVLTKAGLRRVDESHSNECDTVFKRTWHNLRSNARDVWFFENQCIEWIKTDHLLLLYVLAGDHKQLRPSPADHVVAKDFKLEVSLFERLSNNNMPCKALNVQHRMRPEIASLIEFIYPGLQNHDSVHNYPAIRGLNNSLFFVNHNEPEQQVCH